MLDNLVQWRSKRKAIRAASERAYHALMSTALSEQLYKKGGVPDTFEGRFQMVALHAGIISGRCTEDTSAGLKAFLKQLQEQIFEGFEHALRENGAGDSSIARKIRKLGEEYVGLGGAMYVALDKSTHEDIAAVRDVLERNGVVSTDHSQHLGAYLFEQFSRLRQSDENALLEHDYEWFNIKI